MKKVKYKRYKSIVNTCKLLRKKDKSFMGINSAIYVLKMKLTQIDSCLRKPDVKKSIKTLCLYNL